MTLRIAPDFFRARLSMPKEVVLSPAQLKLWEETRARFLFTCPAFSHILYDLMLIRGSGRSALALFTHEVPIAATDGDHLLLNPDTFFKLSAAERVFVIAHEVLHALFNHMAMMHTLRRRKKVVYLDGTTLDYQHGVMNAAMDYVINDMLVKSGTGKMPDVGLHDPRIGTSDESVVDVYRKLYKKLESEGRLKDFEGQGFDSHLDPGQIDNIKTAEQAIDERPEQSWKTAAVQAAKIDQQFGNGAMNLDRHFSAYLEPKVDWRDHIRSELNRKVGSGGYNWRKADRRMISRGGWLGEPVSTPSRAGHGCGKIVVAADTSGSITGKILDTFFAEMAAILSELAPEELIVIWCDAKVHRVDYLTDVGDLEVVRCKGAPGGGGTSFIPPFEEVEAMGVHVDALIYLTDLEGRFPPEPPAYPVIWGCINSKEAPFGTTVHIDLSNG